MEYIKEDQILLREELCAMVIDKNEIKYRPTIMFRNNIRLANSIASKFSEPRDNSLDKEDILQWAYQGLWQSVLSFDESKGYEFSTYAVPMIRGQILRGLRDTNSLHIPRSFLDIRSALDRHGFTLPLSDEEIDILISEGKISRKQIMEYSDFSVNSIDTTIPGSDTEVTLESIIPDKSVDVQGHFTEDEIEEIIDRVVQYIKPNHRDLVEEWMYATLEGTKLNQMTLAKKYKVSQTLTSRVLTSAIDIVKMHGEEIRNLFGY